MRPPPPPPTVDNNIHQVDTNILNVDMAALGRAAPFATGDPTICGKCRACLSSVSIINLARNVGGTAAAAAAVGAGVGVGAGVSAGASTSAQGNVGPGGDVIEGMYDWTCEYCENVNRVELGPMEKPVEGEESVDYVLEPAPAVAAGGAVGVAGGQGGVGNKVGDWGGRGGWGVTGGPRSPRHG